MPVTMTDEIKEIITKTNSDVNNDTKYKTDLELYGQKEYWEPSGGVAGDCEDYALEKRTRLLETGLFGLEDLRLTTCWVEGKDGTPGTGGYHAVLIVVTDQGDFVLDNRAFNPELWNLFPYKWDRTLVFDPEEQRSKWRKINA